jgi:F-type H+-transporting ATPase subunit a
VMSGTVVAAILLSVAPFFFPVLLQLLGLLTGVIQAYIFAVLAMVYIVSASGREPGAANSRPPTKDAGVHDTSKERNP